MLLYRLRTVVRPGDNMQNCLARLGALAVLALLSACGGGNKGPSTSITVSPQQLSFHAASGVPTAPAQAVHVSFIGDGVLVGYPPGVTPPQWLAVNQAGAVQNNAVDFQVAVQSTGLAIGTYQSTLRFVTGRVPNGDVNNATDVVYSDVSVNLQVDSFAVSPATFTLTQVRGAQPAPSAQRSFLIQGTNLAWTAVADQPWISLSQGSGQGPATVTFSTAADLAYGHYVGKITIHNATTATDLSVGVAVDVVAPVLTAQPGQLAYAVDVATTGAGLTKSLTLSDQLNSSDASQAVRWTLSTDQPWLKADMNSGTSSPSPTVQLTIDQSALSKMDDGSYNANVALQYTAADGHNGTLTVPVVLQLNLPRVTAVSSSLGYSDRQFEVVLRGQGLSQINSPGQVLFAQTPASSVQAFNDRDLRVKYPALGPGSYAVSISNALGVATPTAVFTVIAPQNLPVATLSLSNGSKSRVLYDARRMTLYVENGAQVQVDRFTVKNGSWVAGSPINFGGGSAGPTDIAFSTDGDHLVLLTFDSFYDLDLTNSSATPAAVAATPLKGQSGYPTRMVTLDDGTGLAQAPTYPNGTFYLYNFNLHTFSGGPALQADRDVVASGDGRLVLVPNSTTPPLQMYYPSLGPGVSSNVNETSVIPAANRDGSRLIADHSLRVLDASATPGQFTLRGTLPGQPATSGNSFAPKRLLSSDGTRAFAVELDSIGQPVQVHEYDLSQPASGNYADIATYPLPPHMSGTSSAPPPELALSADGANLFVLGTQLGAVLQVK